MRPPFSAAYASAAGRNGSRDSTVLVRAPDKMATLTPLARSWATASSVAREMTPCWGED
jgi:hypothetical protein